MRVDKIVIGLSSCAVIGALVYMVRELTTEVREDEESRQVSTVNSDAIKRDDAVGKSAGIANVDKAVVRGGKQGRKGTGADLRPLRDREVPRRGEEYDNMSDADKKTYDDIQSALDDERIADIKGLARVARESECVEVRRQAVSALQWFGANSISDLVPFLGDDDEDVRQCAMNAIEHGLSQIDDEKTKTSNIEQLLSIKDACTPDGVAMLAGMLNGISDELLSASAVVRVLGTEPDASVTEQLKDAYEFITGESYTSTEAFDRWCSKKRAERVESENEAAADPGEDIEEDNGADDGE